MSVAWLWEVIWSDLYGNRDRMPLSKERADELIRRDCVQNPLDKIERARFVGSYGASERLMKIASVAGLIKKSVSIANWLYLTEEYPDDGLPSRAVATKHPEAKIRAYFLFNSLVRLLKLVDAPPQMSRDLKVLLLDPNKPRRADGRARLQRELLKGGKLKVRPLGKKVRYAHTEIKKDIDKKFVVVPPSVRSDSAST